MDSLKAIEQMLVNNLGNRLTVELASGILNTIASYLPKIEIVDEIPKKEE